MCKGQGGTSTQNQTSSVTIPPEVLDQYRQVWGRASTAANEPFQDYGGQFVAPVNQTQQGGINAISGAGGIIGPTRDVANATVGAGVAGAQPWYQTAGQEYGFAGGLAGRTANPISGGDIQHYMSPYTQNVVDATTAWLNQQNKQQQTDLNTSAIAQGAFGGDRSGIASGVLSGQQNMANASTIAGLYNQNYAQALAAAQQQQQTTQGAAGLISNIGQLSQGLGQTQFNNGLAAGSAYNQFGGDAVSRALQQGQMQLGAGTVPQQTEQAGLSALYNQYLMRQAYPFQTSQFLANIAGGLGPAYGSTTSAQGSSFQPQPFFSDDKLKEDVHEIGRTKDGIKIVRYRYKEDPHKLLRIGFLASDVEKKMPEAVEHHGGLRSVDYERAARASGGGLVSNDNAYEGFAKGGDTGGSLDPTVMAAVLAAQKAMFPGAAGRPGIGDSTGPHGIQLHQPAGRELMKAPLLDLRQKDQPSEMGAALKTGADLSKAGEGIGSIYSTGRDAVVGSPAKGTPGTPSYVPPSGGLIGTGGKYDWDQGWIGRNTGAGVASVPANTNTITSTPLPPPVDTTSASLVPPDLDTTGSYFANRGGRMRRAAGGRGSSGFIPYASDAGYVPVEDFAPFTRTPLGEQQKNLMNMSPDKGGSGGGGSGVLGSLSNLATIGKGVAGLGGLFGGAGVGADMLPMSGLGALTGDAAMGAAAGAGGFDALTMLPILALKRGGRAGYEAGGSPDTYGPSDDPDATNVVPFRVREEPKVQGLVVPRRDEYGPPPVPLQPPPDLRPPVPTREARNPERPAERDRAAGLVPVEPQDPAAEVQAAARAEPPVTPPATAAPTAAPPATGGVVPAPVPPAPTANPATRPSGGFDRAVERTLGYEGGYNARDANGAPVNMGINQAYHPEVDVRNLTREQARDIYRRKYWDAIGGDSLDPKIQAMAFDTAVISGPEKAKELLAASGGDPVKFMQMRQQFEEGLIKSDPQKYGKYAQAWANRRADLNSGNPLSGPAVGAAMPQPTSGVVPADLSAAGGPPKQDWWDRNEKYVVPALAFLGNMLASPSRTLAGSIGSGMVGGANALAQQQGISQGQQRIDITQRSQWMSQWAQLKQIISAQIANSPSGQADPQLVAQMRNLERLIGMGGPATAGTGNSPAGAPAGGVAPTAAPPAEGLVPPAAAPPQPAPAPIGAAPPTGTPPAATPIQPGQPADVPASEKLPTVDFPPGFLQQLAPTANPVELRRRAGEVPDAGQAAELRRRADQAQADIIRNGGGQGNNGFVPLPSAGAYAQAQARIPDNVAWTTAQAPIFQQRQVMRNSIEHIAKTVEAFEPGALSDYKAEAQALASALGVPPPNTATMNAAEFQTFVKNARNVVVGSATGDQKTDAARQILAEGFADPHLQPKAVRRILAQALGNLDAADDYYRDVTQTLPRVPHLDRAQRTNEFNEKHPIEGYYKKHEADIAVRGDLPDKFSKGDVGRAYIMTPEEMLQRFPKNADVTLPQVRDKWFDGKNTARRFRIGPDGRPVPDGR